MVTIGSILTLFALMQLTGRVNWEEKFRQGAGSLAPPRRALPGLGQHESRSQGSPC